ncbi:MAG: nucleotide exchange factor GrpE [Candidatus Verstraetearchaeota archaeon]|nr:nucleotide exchange factor GrpE [Candidatus Verstraetearchaeota archaeon]
MSKETEQEHQESERKPSSQPQQSLKPKTAQQIDALILALAEEKRCSEEYLNRLKYLQADFENYQKRMDKQLEEVKRCSNQRLICELLEVLDELEMAVKTGSEAGPVDALIQGVEMTLKKLRKVLEAEGVSPIACVGKRFDPSVHAAVSTVEREGVEEGTVLEEVRRGYTMNEKVIRPSIVKVAVKNSGSKKENEDKNQGKNQEVKHNE